MSCILRRIPIVLCLFMMAVSSIKAAPTADYTLTPQDLVVVDVFRQPDLRIEQRIDSSGQVQIPLVGSVQIAGMTRREAEAKIAQAFIEGEFLRNPQVSLSIQQYAARGVSVMGEVKSPGFIKFDIERNAMDIREVIAQSGGFTSVAKQSDIKVIRANTQQEIRLNFGDLVNRGQATSFLVNDGDVVMVPDRIF